jgi:TolA-binding protein
VKVHRGHVIVRVPPDYEDGDTTEISLEAGRAWEAPAPLPASLTASPTPVSVEARPAPRPAPHHRARPRPPAAAAPAQDPAEQAFGEGLALLRASDLPAAARAFDRAVRLAPLGTLAEDASYWRAIALADNPAGEAALLAFLDRFPQSARAGEVSVMLGWRLVDRDPRAAASRFQAALSDRAARVRKSARAGLDAVARKTRD